MTIAYSAYCHNQINTELLQCISTYSVTAAPKLSIPGALACLAFIAQRMSVSV